MATSFLFNGRIIKLPGAYAITRANVSPAAIVADYSKVLIVDTGSNAGWGSGSGIAGEYANKRDSLYSFRSAGEMQAFLKGGPLYPLANALFRPSNMRDALGVSEVFFVSAKKTTAAVINATVSGGKLTIIVREEGTFANGKLSTDKVLITGYGMTISSGRRDASKFIISFSVGTFSGLAPDGLPYNEIVEENAEPEVVAISPEISTWEEFLTWANNNTNFGLGFIIDESTTAKGNIVAADKTTTPTLASGGTETYGPTYLDQALEFVKSTTASFLLCDQPQVNTTALKLQYFCENESRFPINLVVPGRDKAIDLQEDIADAKTFNSDNVWLVHGGIRKVSALSGTNYREFPALIHAGYVLGRIAGMLPQIPPTFKEIDVFGLLHNPTDFEKEDCLDAGILTSYYDEDLERYVILKGVNTLQNNQKLINVDGTTHSIQLRRIADTINREMVMDAKREIFSQRNGVTTTSVSTQYLIDWVAIKLQQKVDRELITFFDKGTISVTRVEDSYNVSYEFRPNFEINFIFMTGFMID